MDHSSWLAAQRSESVNLGQVMRVILQPKHSDGETAKDSECYTASSCPFHANEPFTCQDLVWLRTCRETFSTSSRRRREKSMPITCHEHCQLSTTTVSRTRLPYLTLRMCLCDFHNPITRSITTVQDTSKALYWRQDQRIWEVPEDVVC